ncbi:MAG: hypothetical protein RL609_1457 [Bacteroidota bacterium]|jgi:hypothetical protein
METPMIWHLTNMKRCLIIGVFLFWASNLWCQVQGKVSDAERHSAIQGAWIVLDNGRSAYSNVQGEFVIQDKRSKSDNIQVQILMTGYANWKFVGQLQDFPNEISLQALPDTLQTLEIVEGPSVVFGSDIYNVGDFLWDDNGDLLLMIYEAEERWKRQEDAKRTLYNGVKILRVISNGNQEGVEHHLYPIPGLVEGFYDQFPGEVMIKGHHQYFMLRDDQLFVVPDSVMKREVMPVVDTLGSGEFVMTDFQATYPAFDYYLASDNGWKSLHHMVDEKEMELFRSEFKYLGPKEKVEAYQFQLDTGVDKEIIAAYMRGFPQSHYHSPINAPLMILGDSLIVLDHLHNQAFYYSKKGQLLQSKKIEYHQLKGTGKWSGKIWKDPVTHKLYTSYLKSGKISIYALNLHQETQTQVITLTHPFVDKIRIKGDQIFYIYRPFESSQKRYLYSEKISP